MRLLRRRDGPSPARPSSGVALSANWLQWPTLACRGGEIKTAGVYYYRDAVGRVLARYGTLVMAELRIETSGEYAGAVRVFVEGELVGSIPHSQAEAFRVVVHQLDELGAPATCRAEVEVDGEWCDVWLVARPAPRPDDDPFLPPSGSCRVILDSGQGERLNDSMRSTAKRKRVVVLGSLSKTTDKWEVALDGERIGVLESDSHPALTAALAAGFPMTCWVRILREPERPLRVTADIPIARDS